MLGPLRSHRKHEISCLATGVPNANIDGSRQLEPHLGQQSASFPDDARAIWRRLVPIRRQTHERPRCTRALCANNHVVGRSRVLDGDHLLSFGSLDPKFLGRDGRIGEKPLTEIRIDPCPRHDSRAIGGGKLLHGTLCPLFGFARPDQAAIDERVAQSKGSPFERSSLEAAWMGLDAMHSLRLQVALKKFDEYSLRRVALVPQVRRRKFDGIAVLATFDRRMGSKLGIVGARIN